MSFDYLNDLFGKFRKEKKTKFTDLENRAKDLLIRMHRGAVSFDQFYEQFDGMMREFLELSSNIIDENTPIWMNMFGANVFCKWKTWHLLRKMHAEHPEKFSEPETEARYREIAALHYDEWLLSKIKYCISEFNGKP